MRNTELIQEVRYFIRCPYCNQEMELNGEQSSLDIIDCPLCGEPIKIIK